MGFLVNHEDGTTRDIVSKSHDDATGEEVFTAADGSTYTRSDLAGLGSVHTVTDWPRKQKLWDGVEENDDDLVAQAPADPDAPVLVPSETNDGTPQADTPPAGEDASGEAVPVATDEEVADTAASA